jgi:hypothetical protein
MPPFIIGPLCAEAASMTHIGSVPATVASNLFMTTSLERDELCKPWRWTFRSVRLPSDADTGVLSSRGIGRDVSLSSLEPEIPKAAANLKIRQTRVAICAATNIVSAIFL